MTGLRSHFSPTAVTKGPSGRAAESPLEVMPISVWNPRAQSIEFPPSMPEDVRRDRFGVEGDEDSLLSNAELAAGGRLRKSIRLHLSASSLLYVTYYFYLVPWQTATQLKSLARRISLNEGSVRVAKAYKDKVTSLTSERADLQARL